MPARQQADHHPLDQALLADDDPLDLEHHPLERAGVGRGRRGRRVGRASRGVLPDGRRRSRYGTRLYVAWVSEATRRVAAVLGQGLPRRRDRSTCSGATRRCTTRRGSSTGWPATSTPTTSPTSWPARGFLLDRRPVRPLTCVSRRWRTSCAAGCTKPAVADAVPGLLAGDRGADDRGELVVGGARRAAGRAGRSRACANRQVRSWPSAVSRSRSQSRQNGRVTDAMMPSASRAGSAHAARSGPSTTSNSSAGAWPRCPRGSSTIVALQQRRGSPRR